MEYVVINQESTFANKCELLKYKAILNHHNMDFTEDKHTNVRTGLHNGLFVFIDQCLCAYEQRQYSQRCFVLISSMVRLHNATPTVWSGIFEKLKI